MSSARKSRHRQPKEGKRKKPAEGVSDRVSDVMRSRTRTMDSEVTTEFSPQDYRTPESSAGDPDEAGRTRVDDATMRRLGKHAKGVSSLRESVAADRERAEEVPHEKGRAGKGGGKGSGKPQKRAPMPRSKAIAIGVTVGVLAVALIVGAYFLFRSALESLGSSTNDTDSAMYAVDRYTVIAEENDGTLAAVYIAYVDSITSRTELCLLDPATSTATSSTSGTVASDGSIETLAQVWESRGVAGLVRSLETMGNIDICGGISVDSTQMDQIMDLASNASSTVSPSELAAEISAGQEGDETLTKKAIQGLLLTIRDIGPDGYAVLVAPADDQESDGTTVKVLRSDDWLVMLGGMRDTAGEISA
jgi:hypothetical protein